jgi:hypothetical protein
VTGSAADDDELFASWVSFARYPAMLAGTVAGQLVGIAVGAAVGSRSLWMPLVLSVVLEAIVGVRYGATRGQTLDARKCVRVSWTYSLMLAGISAPLVAWIAASNAQSVPGGVGYSFVTPVHVALALVAFALATAGRAGLMIALVTRRR